MSQSLSKPYETIEPLEKGNTTTRHYRNWSREMWHGKFVLFSQLAPYDQKQKKGGAFL